MSIKVENITKLYGTQKALDDVSFTINSGEITGFLGPNGAGKSTMMKIITGFIPQTSGNVIIDGKNAEINNIEIRRKIGYLPENNPLYFQMYVKEYLEFVAGFYNKTQINKTQIDNAVEKTGLTREQNKKIGALSKGYKQRVGLAQALLHNPQILILDEPTSGLDPNQIIEIRNLIKEIGSEKTVMLSTHIMQEVEAICQKVIIINQGKIVASGTPQEIKKETLFEKHNIVVEFEKEIELKKLKEIEGIADLNSTNGKIWYISCDNSLYCRKNIYNYSINNQMVILSMYEKENSLEQLFQKLTNIK